MNYYLAKPIILNNEGKRVKQQYIIKAESNILADGVLVMNLSGEQIEEIPDINKQNYVDIISSELGGNWYNIVCEWDNVEGKTVKDSYLIQNIDINAAMTKVYELSPNCEIVKAVKTQILDYFIQEEEV